MGQLLHECPECGWTGDSDKCRQLCPNCSGMDVINRINKDGETVADSDDDYKHWTAVVIPVFDHTHCGFSS